VALWNSNKDPVPASLDPEEDDLMIAQESAEEVLNDVTPEKERAFAWLEQGAEEILGLPDS
jgi:hypothetical protein